jgi:acyl carrier protein
MNAAEFLEKFRDQFEDTDPADIELSTVYKDLDEWSSIVSFALIAMVKVEYNKTVTGAEIRHCNTVEDLYNLIAAK